VHPVIVLPVRILNVNDEALRAALSHELAHIKRRDYAGNLLIEIASLVLAFHPAIIWIKRQIAATRELACDDLASDNCPTRAQYARGFAQLVRMLSHPQPVAAAVSALDGNNLEERVMYLFQPPRRGSRLIAILFTTVALTVLAATSAAAASLAWNPADSAKASALTGTWTGSIEEKLPDGKTGRGTVYLSMQVSGENVTGVLGPAKEHATPIESGTFRDNHLTVTTEAHPQLKWTLKLVPNGDELTGTGHAERADGHAWDVGVKLTKQK
jgi:hypothetical protein